MTVFTRIELDIETGAVLCREGYEYNGEWAECKRGRAKAEADRLIDYGKGKADQMTALQTFMASPGAQALIRLLQQPGGFPPGMLELMKGRFTDATTNAYNSALSSVKTKLGQRGEGGMNPAGGLMGQGFGFLENQRAQALSGGLRDIDIASGQQFLKNQLAASQGLGQLASIFSPAPFTALSGSAMGSRAELETAPTLLNNVITKLTPGVNFNIGATLPMGGAD